MEIWMASAGSERLVLEIMKNINDLISELVSEDPIFKEDLQEARKWFIDKFKTDPVFEAEADKLLKQSYSNSKKKRITKKARL